MGCVYFVQQGISGPIKIGKTGNLRARMDALQTSAPEELHLLGIMKDASEYQLHAQFDHLRLRGEWFRGEPELLAFIEKNRFHCAGCRCGEH